MSTVHNLPPKHSCFRGLFQRSKIWDHIFTDSNFQSLSPSVCLRKGRFQKCPKELKATITLLFIQSWVFKDVCFALLRITDQSDRTLARHFNLVGYPTALRVVFHPSQTRCVGMFFFAGNCYFPHHERPDTPAFGDAGFIRKTGNPLVAWGETP